jgi:hypothetical protein
LSGEPTVSVETLCGDARAVLERNWRPEGYTVPNAPTYPYQWLWDSCFHAIAWAHLGEGERATLELTHLFRNQDATGFVPHIDYEPDPDVLASFWGRRGASSITQPPMYGHAIAELTRCGVAVAADVVERAANGLRFLFDRRARDEQSGLVTIVHPWESGSDDSPRWDHWDVDDSWYETKGALLAAVERSATGAPIANPQFGAAPVAFNALLAFNAHELADVCGDEGLRRHAADLAGAIDARWDDDLATWIDSGPAAATSGRIRTLDALVATLVCRHRNERHLDRALALALDDRAYGGRCGPAGVHRAEPSFRPRSYWRGSAWPQLTYLLWVAARRNGRDDAAASLAARLVAGAHISGFAEYWDPDDGTPLGARPQSWSALAAVVATASDRRPG